MMTPLDIMRLIRRWWWIVLVGPLLGAGIAYAVSSASTPMYRSAATVVIEVSGSGGTTGYSSLLEAEKRTATYSRLVETRPVLQEAATRLSLPMTPVQLRGLVTVSPVRDTQLLSIAATDPSPARAAAIANAVADVFIEQQTSREEAAVGSASEVVNNEITRVREEIATLSTQIEEYEARPDAETDAIRSIIRGFESQLTQYQALYSTLLDKQVQQQISSNQELTRLWIAEEAVPPANAVSPRVQLNTAIGGMVGILIAAALVVFIGYLDNTVKTSDDVRRLTGNAAIGAIPLARAKDGLDPLQFPRSPATEAYRALRTNLQFASLGRDVRSLVVTSPRPGDGKTTTIANLGTVLAQGGQRVILVDADLRKPRLHKTFSGLANRTGLTNLLLADARVDLDPLLQLTAVPNLRILTTGPLPPNPSDVLNSPRMRDVIAQLTEAADVVLIDAPPMAVSDALIIASLVDGVMLVTTGGRTRANELVGVAEALARSGTTLSGVVINRARLEGESYYYYQSYYTADSEPPGTSGGGGDTDSSSHARDRRRMPTPFGRRSASPEQGGGHGASGT